MDEIISDFQNSEAHPDVQIGDTGYRRAFAVADELGVHGAQCVCPRCAGRLPGLLIELARALDQVGDRSGR